MNRPTEIFVSHAVKDRRFADRLVAALRANGFNVWYSDIHLAGADDWQDEIGKALRRCDWFLVVLSKNAIDSMWVSREVKFAQANKRLHGKIVPVYCRTCEIGKLSWVLETIQYVDFRKDFDAGLEQLFRIWS